MASPWLIVSKPLSGSLYDGSSVLVRSLIRELDRDSGIKIAYFGDRKRPIRDHVDDQIIDLPPMGHAPSMFEKVRVLTQVASPGRWNWPIHWFFTPNRSTSTVVSGLRRLNPRRSMVQSLMSSNDVSEMIPWLHSLDRIVTLSDFTASKLIAGGIDPAKVRRIYPGVSVLGNGGPMNVEQRLDPARFRRVLYAGDLDERVLRILVGFVQGLRQAFQEPWQFIIACREKSPNDAKLRQELRFKLAESIRDERVRLLGTINDLPAWMEHCGIQVFVADHVRRKVDLPLVILEGMARGQILLASDFEPISEIFKRAKERGFCIGASVPTSNSPEDWVRVLVDHASNISNCHQWSTNARKLIETEFSAARLAKEHVHLYAELKS